MNSKRMVTAGLTAALLTGLCLADTLSVSAQESSVWEEVPETFVFSSGVGGWATELQMKEDGSFSGAYHDSDMGGTGNGYPNGTVYICNFTGRFSEPVKVGPYEYEMDLEELKTDGMDGEEYFKDGVRYVYSDPYGISGSDQFLLYTPGQPYDEVSEDFAWWIQNFEVDRSTEKMTIYAICNAQTQDGFAAYESNEGCDEGTYIFEKSDQEYLTQQDIAYMTTEDIQLAINEIYARHGRVFQNTDVAEYFAARGWYHPVQGKSDDQIVAEFNSYEKANVDFLAQYLQ